MRAFDRQLPDVTWADKSKWVPFRQLLAFLLSWLLVIAPFQGQFTDAQAAVARHESSSLASITPALLQGSPRNAAPNASRGNDGKNLGVPTLSDRKTEPASPAVHQRKSTLAGITPRATPRASAFIGPAMSDRIGALPFSSTRLFGPLLAALPQSNTPSNTSTITSNFNGTSIAAGNYIWFNSVMKVSGLGSGGGKIILRGGTIQFTANSVAYNLTVPDATITFSSNVTSASTSFDAVNNRWNTSIPASFSQNVFLTGLAYPVSTTLPGSINPVNWTETFYTDTSGVSVQWQWAAAVYTSLTTQPNSIGVKPVDGNAVNPYANSDHAGTPENYKPFVIGGAGGGGGSNWTGSYSGTASVTPAQISTLPPVANAGPNQSVYVGTTVQLDGTGSYDPAGFPLTYSWSFVSVPTGSVAALNATNVPKPTFVVDKPGTYNVQLIVNDSYTNSAPSQVSITTLNTPPVANAGANQTVTVGTTVQLDGSKSSDVDGDSLTYSWSFVSVPSGSAAVLSNPTSVRPTFVVDEQGSYTIQLIVNDGTFNSNPSNVTISTQNSPPVANAGPAQQILANTKVFLNGSASSDVDGDALTYSWTILSTPEGSSAVLSNNTSVTPSFFADLSGVYVVQLIVNDGTVNSTPSTVTITTGNTPPIANAGLPKTVSVGTVVALDGTKSFDADGDSLTYQWAMLSRPAGSAAVISPNTSPTPSFQVDQPGDYVAQLVVNDGYSSSAPATVLISTIHATPTANAGPQQTVLAGSTVNLDGSGSTDSSGLALTYTWSLLTRPAGSAASLSSIHTAKPTFVVDVTGEYVAQLVVNDGQISSAPATVLITAVLPPIVNAGPNQTIPAPNTLSLEGSVASRNNPPGTVTAQWTQVSGPAMSFTNPTNPTTTADFNTAGTYVLRLTGTEGNLQASSTVTITATASNQPPVVNAGPDQAIQLPPTNTATLAGSATDDGLPAGSTLTYAWSQVSGPVTATISSPTSPTTTATFSATGTYTFRLTVSDSQLSGIANTHVKVYPPDQPPVVNAGPSQTITLPTNTVTLTGSASDTGILANLLTVRWSLVSGPGSVIFANAASLVTVATFSQAGIYQLRLTASDTQLQASSDTYVTVNPPPPPAPGPTLVVNPSAAGPNVVGATQSLTATLKNGQGVPISGQTVTFTVTGPNATTGTATTDTNGNAAFTYTGTHNGTDSVQAQTIISGATLSSNTGAVSWITSSGYAPAIDLEPIGTDSTLNGGALDGAFTDSNGAVILPVAIGDAANLAVPIGATQLQLGVNDGFFEDNAGSWLVNVNGSPVTVPGTAMPWRVQGGLNAAIPYGFQDGTSPVVAATNLTPGQNVSIAYQSGTVSLRAGSFPFEDANGIPNSPSGSGIGFGGKLNATFYMSTLKYTIGERASLTASVTFGSGTLIPNQAVTFSVTGANPQQFQTSTDGTGTAAFTYQGFSAGSDEVQAETQLNGVSVFSKVRIVSWVVVPNQAPSVNAGPNQTITYPNVVTLNGSATDDGLPNGTLTIAWTTVSGQGAVTFSSPNQAVTQAAFSAPGTYVLQLSANDSQYTSTSNVTITVNPASQPVQPPVVSAGPSQTVVFPNAATLQGSMSDSVLPPGATLTSSWSVLGGPGTVTFGNATQLVTTASFSTTGTYLLQLSASNTQYSSSATTTATVIAAPSTPNQPPVVSASAVSPVVLPNAVTLNGKATDDGLPNNTLTVQWSSLGGPGTVTFANPAAASTQATFSTAGTYVLQFSACDSQYTSTVTLTITAVNAPSSGTSIQPPVVSAGNPQTITLPTETATLYGLVSDNSVPASQLTIAWNEISGPTSVIFSSPSTAKTSATFNTAGVYLLQLSAFDGQYTTTAQTTVTVTSQSSGGGAQNQPPSVNAGPSTTIYLPNNVVTLNGSASDDGLPSNTLNVSWSEVSGPGTVTFSSPMNAVTQATFPAAGSYVLQLSASDTQLTSTSQMTVTVLAQPAPPPTVSITAPTDGTEITKPSPVTGTVSGGNWMLQYAQLVPDNPSAQQWITFASGSGAVSGTLGTLDPTILLNGEYSIQLMSVNTSGQFATSSISVAVDRNMKVGVFSLAFNDLSVPVAGFPIQITRSYDSRDKSNGDFGVGWRLSIANARVQKNHNLGLAWQQTIIFSGFLPQYCVEPTVATTVTITFPDGKVYSFQSSVSKTCQSAGPFATDTLSFVQLPGPASTAGATLTPADGGQVLVEGDLPGPSSLYGFDGNIYNPTAFQLTTAQGVTYTIDQALGVTSVKDLNGNSLTIAANSITSSTGKSVAINRNGQGFVTSITDPNGISLSYGYDNNNLSTFTDRVGNITRFAYDGSHNLTGITLPNGQSGLTNTYDPATGRLTGTADGLGVSTTFTQNVATQTETVTDRNGNATTYVYDADGNIVQTTDALQHVSYAKYDSSDNKTSETNALRETTTYAYDQFGNRLSEVDPLHHETTYSYSPLQQLQTVTDPLGHTTTNTYDTNGNLVATKDPLGNITKKLYFSNGQLQQTTDALKNTTSFTYFPSGDLQTQTDAMKTVTTYTYDSNGNRQTQSVTRTLPGGGTQTLLTQFVYDYNDRLKKTIYPDLTFTQVQYNPQGQQSATIDAKQNTTSYSYDNDGRLTSTNYPDQTSESSTYDGNGNRLTSTDRAKNVTTYTYDQLNRLTTTLYVDNSTTLTTYDAIGEVLKAKDANGNLTQYAYDAAGRRTSMTDAQSHVTTFSYDDAGNQISVADANAHVTQYAYDDSNRRTQVTYADGKSEATAYDALGRVVSRTDANGKVTQYGYDALGRLTSVTQDAVNGGLNLLTQYTYDEVGNRLTQTDANTHTTNYQYDQRGRRTQRALPLGQTETYAYDGNGNLSSRTDFNLRTTKYTYDTMNRLLAKTADAYFAQNHIGAAGVSFTYTATGKRQTMADASGMTTYGYNNRDRLVSEATPEGTLTYAYDAAGDVKTIASSNTNGASIAYGYDTLNRLSSVTDANGATGYGYDPAGNLQTVTYPNGVVLGYSYDVRNRLTGLAVAKGSAQLTGYSYLLDAAGHRLSVTELSGRTVNYGYDNLYRLTSETIAADPNGINGAVGYTYDAVGNRKQMSSTVPGLPAGLWNYDANDRLGLDVYDADGNTVSSGGLNYAYDFENRLVQQGGLSIVYDGDGNRVSKTVAGVTTQYLVDTQNPTGYAQVLDELQSGTVTRTYTWGSELISEHQSINSTLTTSYYVFDGHGSVRALTNSAGAVTDTYDYDAFGNLLHSTGTTANNYLFASEQFDPNLNLYYNRARYLSTNTGRFWSMDTDEGDENDPLSLHKYLFVKANPVDNSDPSGNQIDDIGAIAAGMTLDTMPTISPIIVRVILHIVPYQVVVVTLPTGGTYEPLSKVKNPDQAVIAGVPVNTPIRIAVPPGIDPQTMVDHWSSGSLWSSRSALNPRTWFAFKKFWSDPNNNFKSQGRIFDAFGNFELGATGAAAFIGLPILEIEAAHLHGGTNDPINKADIESGFEAIAKGGKLSTTIERLVP